MPVEWVGGKFIWFGICVQGDLFLALIVRHLQRQSPHQ
jgi:hypothetical protein